MSDSNSLPDSWALPAVSNVCEILSGYGFPKSLQGRKTGDLPFFKVLDISEAWQRGERYLERAHNYLTQSEAESIRARPLPTGTVVFAKIGAAISLNRRAILSQPRWSSSDS